MGRHIEVRFPGGKKVDACWDGFVVHTDQAVEDGGEGSAPAPFDYFFVSIATCAGITALAYCRRHKLPAEGLAVTLSADQDPGEYRFGKIRITVRLPAGFPPDHVASLRERVDGCVVKKHILNPPAFELAVSAGA